MSEITEVFQTRDAAVKAKDAKLFLSTQVDEIPHGGSEGYLSLNQLTTKVLATEPEEISLTKVVFVKETYRYKTGLSRSVFLLYRLVDTPEGWRVYRVST